MFKEFDAPARGVMIAEMFSHIVHDQGDPIRLSLQRAAEMLGFPDDKEGVDVALHIMTGN